MKIYSRKLPPHEVDHLVRMLKRHEKETLNPNIAHYFIYEGVAISVYKTNVVLFQGQYIDYVVDILLQKKGHQLTQLIMDVSGLNEKPKKPTEQTEIGGDEVGSNDYFGGVVVAAVAIDPSQHETLKTELMRDSKLIDDQKIIKLYDRLSSQVKFSYTSISASEYNELFEKFKNAHAVSAYLHNQTLADLIEREQIDQTKVKIILDQFVPPKKYLEYLSLINPPSQITIDTFEIRAETKHLAVALASVIARYQFLKQIDELHAKADLPIFLGSTNPQIKIVARQVLEKYGIGEFKKFVKYHFKTTDAIVQKKQVKRASSAA